MPEQITKYPDVTLRVLKGSGARCGEGAPQKILTKCPEEQFCSLTSGEVCIYGIEQIPQMTQITTQEIARIVCPAERPTSMVLSPVSGFELAVLGGVFAVGVVVGGLRRKGR